MTYIDILGFFIMFITGTALVVGFLFLKERLTRKKRKEKIKEKIKEILDDETLSRNEKEIKLRNYILNN